MNNTKVLSLKSVVVFMIIAGIICLSIFSLDIILMLFSAFVITCAINPIINKLETKIPRIWAVSLVLLALIFAGVLILIPLISICVKEAIAMASNFPNIIDNIERFLNIKIFNTSISSLITFESIKEPLAQGAQSLIENSIVAGKWIASSLTTIFAIAIIVFYLAYDDKRLKDKFIEFFPQKQKKAAARILDNISSKVGNYVFAQGITMVSVGVLTAIFLLILQNPHAILLGFITCVFDIIPVVGPVFAIALGLLSSLSGGIWIVLATFVVFMIAQWAQNQFVRPAVFAKLLDMHPLVIIVALLISARFLGFWGVILSPAIASVICVLVDELYLNRINNK